VFSLRETDDGAFIYKCHACGWQCELTATDQNTAADQALPCDHTHKCAAAQPSASNTQAPKAS
jgi:hypothetical protein